MSDSIQQNKAKYKLTELEQITSPEFIEIVIDFYKFISKYSGNELARRLGVTPQSLNDRTRRSRMKKSKE